MSLSTALFLAAWCGLTVTAAAQPTAPTGATPPPAVAPSVDPFAPPPPGSGGAAGGSVETLDRVFLKDGSMLEGHVRGYRREAVQLSNVALGEVAIPPAAIARVSLARERVMYLQHERGRASRAVILTTGSDGQLAYRELNTQEVKPLEYDNLYQMGPDTISETLWSGSLGVTSSLLFGNTEEVSVGILAVIARETPIDLLDMSFEFSFLQTSDEAGNTDVTKRYFDGKALYRYFMDETLGSFVTNAVRKDSLAGIRFRYIANMGISWIVTRQPADRLIFDVGLNFTVEDLKSLENEFFGAVIGIDFFREFQTNLSLEYRSLLVVDLTEIAEFQLDVRATLIYTIIGPLSLHVIAENRFDHRPAPGFKQNDLRVIAAISYRFSQ